MKTKKSNGAATTGLLAAIAASSCCIPPVIAAVAGVGGASSSLSWMEPLRPYLIGLAVLAIGYAWYSYLKPKKADHCGCEIEKPKWYQSKGFLIGITVFAVVSISFPYYSHIFFTDNKKEVVLTDESEITNADFKIEGMTCDACQLHVESSVNELDGIVNVSSSYEKGSASVEFDKSQTNLEEIEDAINSTGYTVTNIEEINKTN